MSRKKGKISYNRVDVIKHASKGGVHPILEYCGHKYSHRKNLVSKKLNRTFKVFYCQNNRKEGCTCCIREDISTGVFYHVFDNGAIRPHSQVCRGVSQSQRFGPNPTRANPQKLIPPNSNINVPPPPNVNINQPPPPPPNVNINHHQQQQRNPVFQSPDMDYGRKCSRKRPRIDSEREMPIIHGILPSFGPLKGGNVVDIFFSATERDVYDRFMSENLVSCIRFGKNVVKRFGNVENVLSIVRLESNQYKDELLLDQCKQARFVIQAIVPEGERPGPVNVLLEILGIRILCEDGYRYVDKNEEIEKSRNPFSYPTDEVHEEDEDQKHHNNQSERYPYEDEFSFDIFQNDPDDCDIFGSPLYFYLVAQNRIGDVKKLMEKKVIDLERRDLMGFSVLDVAKHFNNLEIVKLLKKKKKKKKKKYDFYRKVTKFMCSYCDKKVTPKESASTKQVIISHDCNTSGSRELKLKNKPVEEIKTYHKVRNQKKHRLDTQHLKEHGSCSVCEKKLTGDEKFNLSKKSLLIVSRN